MSRTYSTAAAFKQALDARLKEEASHLGQPIARVRQTLVFERLIARVLARRTGDVIVKGGVVVELRTAGARTTKDIDLWWRGNAASVLDELRAAGTGTELDPFAFEVMRDRRRPDLTAAGMKYDGQRFRVQAKLAGRPFADPFGVDVAFAEPLGESPDEIVGRDYLGFAGIAPPRIAVYPRAAHIAEKVHALTLPRKRPNTRVKDLPDIALLAQIGPLKVSAMRAALARTFAHRATHELVTAVPDPPLGWAPVYERMARSDGLRWTTLDELLDAIRAFLDPVLAGARIDTWNAEAWAWPRRDES